jgi:outer membrane immunogenic protein
VGTANQKIDWFGTLRGRVGWLPVNALLVYATGGLAYGHVRTNIAFSEHIEQGANPIDGSTAISQSSTRLGWTAGAGLEWMFAPRWSVKGEYLYYDLGSVTLNQTMVVSAVAIPRIGLAIQSEAHYKGNIARLGVNYRF